MILDALKRKLFLRIKKATIKFLAYVSILPYIKEVIFVDLASNNAIRVVWLVRCVRFYEHAVSCRAVKLRKCVAYGGSKNL